MAEYGKTPFLKKVFFAVWAMTTGILFFSVLLLANELLRVGQNPLTLPETLPEWSKPPAQSSLPAETRDIPLYFASADGRLLVGETRRIQFSAHTLDNCRMALEALIKGPVTPLQPLIPPTVEVRGMYLLNDRELVVDLSYPLQTDAKKSASEESLLVYSVVNTLAQPALKGDHDVAVRSVRFLIGGLPPSEVYPAHLDLSVPVSPDPQWLLTTEGGQTDHA